jgi:hypothetical protein
MSEEVKTEEVKTVTFEQQLKLERDFYLGKSKKIPGSDMTLEEAKAKQAEVNEEFRANAVKHAENVQKALAKADSLFRQEKGISETRTSVVIPGVNVEIKDMPAVPSTIAFAQHSENAIALPITGDGTGKVSQSFSESEKIGAALDLPINSVVADKATTSNTGETNTLATPKPTK